MGAYIVNRILILIPVLFLVSVFVFLLVHLIPGDPIDFMLSGDDAVDPSVREMLMKSFGLDLPLHVQYYNWISRVLVGDFGESIIFLRPCLEIILARFPATILLTIGAMVVSLIIAIPAGVVAAVKRNTPTDHAAMTFALLGISIPNFWLGILLILAFSLYIPIFPATGYDVSISDPIETLRYLTLPSITLGTALAAITARMTRSEMLEEIGKEYVRTARAKGVTQLSVIFKHTLKNALVPVITVVGLQFGHLLGGTVIVEHVFAWPGVGRLGIDAINNNDFPILVCICAMVTILYVALAFIVDLLYAFVDPRIRIN